MSANNMDLPVTRWTEFCAEVQAAGEEILRSAEGADPVSQAEGLRYLTRLLRSGIEKFVEYSDPEEPSLANVYNDHLKWGLDNPDSLYAMSGVKDDVEYEISGNIGTVNYFNLTAAVMTTDAKYTITSTLEGVEVVTDAAGNFTIRVGGAARAENWLPLTPGTNSLLLRQTFVDRSREREMSFRIRLAHSGQPPRPLTMERAIDRLGGAQSFFSRTGKTFVALAERIGRAVNALPLVEPEFMASMGGDPNYAYFWGGFHVAPGEALLIHFPEVPETNTWSLCLYSHWLESLDHTRALINLNKHLAQLNRDGSLTIVIAGEDPGVANWLDTVGHSNGAMMARWVNPARTVPPPLSAVVRLDAVDWSARLKRWSDDGVA